MYSKAVRLLLFLAVSNLTALLYIAIRAKCKD